MNGNGVLNLTNDTVCSFAKRGIYAIDTAKINLDSSSMNFTNMNYTAIMGEGETPEINLANQSSLSINPGAVRRNGITGCNIISDESTIVINNCIQGLTKCSLTLSNSSTADIGNNFWGINTYEGNVVTVNAGTSLNVSDCISKAFLMQGNSQLLVNKGGALTVQGNGYGYVSTNSDKVNPDKSAIDVGAFVSSKYLMVFTTGLVNFEDGANVQITDNYIRGIGNFGTVNIGSGTIITENGKTKTGETGSDCRVENGGGIYNAGTLKLSDGAVLCNNHASVAGDDLYNSHEDYTFNCNNTAGKKYTVTVNGTMTLVPASGFNAVLDDCGHGITGWYYDGIKNGTNTARWNVSGCISGREEYIDEYSVFANDANTVALKATHGTIPVYVPVIVDPTPTPTPTPTPSETIPDENVPATDIPEPNTPKADASAQVTGDSGLIVWSAVTAAFSIAGLAYLSVSAKKRGE